MAWLVQPPRSWAGAGRLPRHRVNATHVGRLLVASGTSDITDAHVVICARRADQPVVTSDPGDLRQLDPALWLIEL